MSGMVYQWAKPLIPGILAGLALVLSPMIARAQYAVGDGHALDQNLQTGASRYNPDRPGFLLNRINNAIATGHAPGGMGFRGDLGYGAAYDFRGDLPSDSIYQFQRDAYSFSIGRRSYGFAQVPSVASATAPGTVSHLTRPGGGVSLAQLARWRYGTESSTANPSNSLGVAAAWRANTIRNETVGRTSDVTGHATGRSSSTVTSRRTLTGSDPLLDWSPLHQVWNPLPEAEGTEAGPTLALAGIESWRRSSLPSPSTRLGSKESEEDGEGTLHAGEDIYRDQLLRMISTTTGRELPELGTTYNPEELSALRAIQKNLASMRWPEMLRDETEDEAAGGTTRATWPMTASRTLEPLSRFAGSTGSSLNQYLRAGEMALSQGNFFEAERWFALARTTEADNPLGLIGQIHSEIGAGLYRSASRHLRTLLAAHPEVIGWSYGSRLLPSPDRMKAATLRIETKLTDREWPDAGLLLAYVGHITNDTTLIEQGLSETRATGVLADPIRAMSRRVWMPEVVGPDALGEEPSK